ncbi:Apolipoprotein N-acyltransferase [Noviherbaspirillum humi]|uniref:Apolipoprotein N-acyltransferase n=1 Tax=Noviherbaspirillum humi TaxID=1688639 RepID=A0A239K8Y8_9BURK|nr:apolipoprotein N-acyltransferase [Noviherbaspirillum humi]SNT14926.1 Apolipoprotein N-acyltransferase [Noviherbaspirillum humi]
MLCIAGALNILSFAPFGAWPLQILTLALLFWMVRHQVAPRRSALLGWAYSFGWLAAGFHWLHISMHDYGGMPAWMSVLAVALLAAGLSAYVAFAMAGATWLARRWTAGPANLLVLLLPSLWTLAEWVRGWLFTGFPWVSSGYAHSNSPLAGYAAVIGVYGLAWVSALIAGGLVAFAGARTAVALPVVLLAAGPLLKLVDWTRPSGQPISVRLVQGNVPQEMKFAPEQLQATLQLYDDLIRQRPADLIATPETALPMLLKNVPADYLPKLAEFARQSGSSIALGIAVNDSPTNYANSVIGIAPFAPLPAYRFDKHHLVPFGEFIPPGARWFVDMMNIPLGDFTPGAAVQKPFAVKDQRVLPNICYEDLFGEEIAGQIAQSYFANLPQPTMMLNVSNIAWFGDSVALPQHLQISQMRALETGRPMLRSTNTGMTAVIDPKGRVQAQLPPFVRGVLSASVQGHAGITPYIYFGNKLPVTLALLALVFACAIGRRTGGQPDNGGAGSRESLKAGQKPLESQV